MASTLLEELKEYFENTPREQILEDWEKTKEYEGVGLSADDFLASVYPPKVNVVSNIYSPSFSSGFLFN